MIKAILTDDQSLFRTALKQSLENSQKIRVVGEAANGQQLLNLYSETAADIILLDIGMPIMDGTEALPKLLKQNHNARVIVLSEHDREPHITQMLNMGAIGYFSKNCGIDELVKGIETIYWDDLNDQPLQTQLSSDIMQQMALSSLAPKRDNGNPNLSKREFQILSQLLNGKNASQIAEAFFISPKTVSVHKTNIMKKMGVTSNLDLFKSSLEYGLIQ
ncbi:MAG: response regulator transcription factor [Gammaproteobacteria bacterium]|jgi:two-component system invasion response regulator UvrY|nr:response regulator transcription factor [Gammaproteobacteria bacterium]MBT4608338.1 response regulator transcription factor [Thiotrichales bacterium]MBT3471641.1 response regulator transcription factor [Gammaproteobacteria bacterium]MBT3968558.1 response regulator transcription factor [Gammaproteobacteria bacterium]MBT4080568.1 response regulator transcription factor [Gammaproteobacteria bacterium]